MTRRYDHHVHIASPGILEMVRGQDLPGFCAGNDGEMTARGVLSWLDRAKIDRAVVISSAFSWSSEAYEVPDGDLEDRIREENTWAADQRALYPERLKCLMSFNPLHTEMALREMARCADELGMDGIKLHFNGNGVNILKPEHLERVRPVFREAARRGLPILLHYGIQNVPNDPGSITPEALDIFVEEILLQSPGLKIQFAHSIGLFSEATEATFHHLTDLRGRNREVAENTWVDISATLVDEATARHYEGILNVTPPQDFKRIAKALRDFGLDHVLFGSDFYVSPTMNPRDYSRFVRENLPLTETEMEAIFTNPGPFWKN